MFQVWHDVGLGGFGLGMIAPTFDFYTSSGSQSSSFRAGSPVVIKARVAPEARNVYVRWTINGNTSGWQNIGQAQNGYFEGSLTFNSPGSYSFVLATPEDFEQPDNAAQNYNYFEVLPALTTAPAPTTTQPAPTYTAPSSSTTSGRTTPSAPVYTAPPPVIDAPVYAYSPPATSTPNAPITPLYTGQTSQTTQQQCPTGYSYYAAQNACISANPQGCAVDEAYNWLTGQCERHNAGTVVAPQAPVVVQNPFYPTNYVPPTQAPPVQQTPVYVPQYPVYNPANQQNPYQTISNPPAAPGASISEFFNSSLNLGGYEVPVLALVGVVGALWFLKG